MLLYALALAFASSASAFLSAPLAASNFPAFEVDQDGSGRLEIGSRMGLMVDSSRSVGLEQARAQNEAWQPITRQSPNFGFTQDSYWFRFQLVNRDTKALTRFIELPIPFLDDVRLYQFAGNALVDQYSLGDEQPFSQRAVRH